MAFTPLVDMAIFFGLDEEGVPVFETDAGIIDGMTFTGNDSKGIRTASLQAVVFTEDDMVSDLATINLYYEDEATFDFANATMGNRAFAWIREIENARTLDNQLYRVSDPDSPIVIDYTFGLDMTAIDFPAQLEPMKSMLPTYSENSTAWDYLLQLAERVCTQTKVTIRAEFSKDLDVDISNLKIVTEYFTPTSINLDANNVLTIVCNWVNQSQPIDPATANSLCILTGIRATVKDTAAFYDNKIAITNNGTVSYDIYLAASSLYSFAQDASNQAKYGLVPYIHEEDCRSDFVTDDPNADESEETATNNDKGAKFSGQYVDFADAYIINTEILNGWHEEGKDYYYYVNNEPVTGVQLVPDRHDASQDRFYEFDETGKLVSESGVNGLVEIGDDLYYAVLGVAQTGWQVIDDKNYYFHPDTGKAVNGEFAIYEAANSWQTKWYTYTFEDHVLVKGAWEEDTYQGVSGRRYRWAGDWKKGCWFEVDGKTYLVGKNYPYYVITGYAHYVKDYQEGEETTGCYLFDDQGALMSEFNGAYYIVSRSEYRYFVGGKLYSTIGIARGNDGHYYYVNGDGTVVTSTSMEVYSNRAHDLVPAGTYEFDAQGRMVNPLVTVVQKGVTAESVTVMGRVVTVKNSLACNLGYLVDGKYVVIPARDNGDGTYSFVVPQDVSEVTLVLKGDANYDGKLDAEDMKLLSEALMPGADELDALAALALDINSNGELNSADKTLLARALLASDHKDYKALAW